MICLYHFYQAVSIKMSKNDQLRGRQVTAARVLLGLAQSELASGANISVPTVRRMEACDDEISGLKNNIEAVRRVLEDKGIVFIPENGGGVGVRMRAPGPLPERPKRNSKVVPE